MPVNIPILNLLFTPAPKLLLLSVLKSILRQLNNILAFVMPCYQIRCSFLFDCLSGLYRILQKPLVYFSLTEINYFSVRLEVRNPIRTRQLIHIGFRYTGILATFFERKHVLLSEKQFFYLFQTFFDYIIFYHDSKFLNY